MNQKEVSELRRRWRPEKNSVSHIYGCFISGSKEIIADLDEPLGQMDQEEAGMYLSLLKKTLSGQLDKHLMDIVFSTQQVQEGAEHQLLRQLRDSGLKDGRLRQAFYQKVRESLDMNGESYLLLMAYDTYDVPRWGKDGRADADASDEVFTYLLCCVCPVKEAKATLGYFPGDNEFHNISRQVVTPPELGFLFPAFDDRSANIYNALYYSRKPETMHHEFIDAVFHMEPPMTAAEQAEEFQSALSNALEEEYSMEVAQAIHEQLSDYIWQHKEARNPEILMVTAEDICAILKSCGIQETRLQKLRQEIESRFGPHVPLNPANIIDAGRFQVKTSVATLSVDPESSYLVETGVINGRQYILIPTDGDVEVNGHAVRAAASAE